MKKIITLACALSCIIGASAQSIYDAVKLAEKGHQILYPSRNRTCSMLYL